MNEAPSDPILPSPAVPPTSAAAPSAGLLRAVWALAVLVLLVGGAALVFAWKAQQRLSLLEPELLRRLQDTQAEVAEARGLAHQAQDSSRDAAAKTALLEARVAEVALQRSQLEDLIQSLSRSRDENLLVDVEAGIRVALQQSAITGSAEPLVATLRQADERLQRHNQPRLEGVRRAISRDLDRVKAVGVADISTLNIRLDEAVRLVDELPLLANPRAGDEDADTTAGSAPGADGAAPTGTGWWPTLQRGVQRFAGSVWTEARSLVRVRRIDHPEALLLSPDQAFFVKENLKLRLMNARLALLSRQFDIAQADLQASRIALERYFDPASRKVTLATELVRQVAAQARQVTLPRPDDTLAAVAAAAAGR